MNADAIKSLFDTAGLDVLSVKPLKVGAALVFRIELTHYPEIDCTLSFYKGKPELEYSFLGYTQQLTALAAASKATLLPNDLVNAKDVGKQLATLVNNTKRLQGFLLLADNVVTKLNGAK